MHSWRDGGVSCCSSVGAGILEPLVAAAEAKGPSGPAVAAAEKAVVVEDGEKEA